MEEKNARLHDFVVDPDAAEEYEAPAPYRRFMRVLIDEVRFPDAPLCMALLTYPPGAGCASHVHGDAAEVYFVLEGDLTATVHQKEYNVAQGRLIYIPSQHEHRAENLGTVPCRFMAVHAPAVEDIAEVRTHWKKISTSDDKERTS
jgi:mannose-6-phosphate isomerase-like protein (cupin superfamily)